MVRRRLDYRLIYKMRLEGKTAPEIARELDCHVNTIYSIWRLMGETDGTIPSEALDSMLAEIREHLRDNIKRARNIRTYCEWTARDVVKDLWDEYRHLQRLKRKWTKEKPPSK